MKRLVPRSEIKNYRLTQIESPFFAVCDVERALARPMDICGLTDLLSECSSSIRGSSCLHNKKSILDKVERGDWLLISSEPFSPLSDDTFGKYSDLTGRSFSMDGFSIRKPEPVRKSLSDGEPLTLPKRLESVREKSKSEGAGKWVLKDIDYDGVKNTVVMLANRLGSLGDEGRMLGSDGKDYTNTTRTLIQEWLPLAEDESHFLSKSAVNRYGELRYIKQQYQAGEDSWHVSGSSWHWQPVTADTVYEYKEEKQ